MGRLERLGSQMTALIALTTFLHAPAATLKTYSVDGVERKATIFSPHTGSAHPPLVFGFHGHGGNMLNSARSFQIQDLWPEAVVVYMQGLPTSGRTDPQGTKPGWQNSKGLYGDRDLAFFDKVFADVTKEFNVDLKRIYAMGHSNGGRFTYLLWAERGSLFAAFAPSGSPSTGLKLSPKPLFQISGEKDPLVPFQGQKLSVDRAMQMDGCTTNGTKLGAYATLYKGKDGNDVVAYFHPGGHEYPRLDGPKLIVDFFKSHKGK